MVGFEADDAVGFWGGDDFDFEFESEFDGVFC